MNAGSRAFPSARVLAPASRNSFTRRSCNVLCARSTRPLAWLELAQIISMFSACGARTKTGYLWVLARDDRPWQGDAPPAVVYNYAPGRGAEHAVVLLRGFAGVLQTDGYAAYRSLADPKRTSRPATLAFCWAHWRRQWFDIAKSPPVPTATEALKR